MTFIGFLKDRLAWIALHIVMMVVLILILTHTQVPWGVILYIIGIWVVIMVISIGVDYWIRKRYFIKLWGMMDSLDEKYLITAMMKKPSHSGDLEFYYLMGQANKSMMEHVAKLQREQREHREFIEKWVHDIKIPVAATELICENDKSTTTKKINIEMEKVEHGIDQVLYYARSEELDKNYYIKEVPIYILIHFAIGKCKKRLRQYEVAIEIHGEDLLIYTDQKWTIFILEQILQNAIQYHSNQPFVTFTVKQSKGNVVLCIRDNGIGIPDEDLDRLCQKGFTGNNGQYNQKSTGIGLYLCKRLANKMGLGFAISSKEGEYTEVTIIFPMDRTNIQLTQ